MIRFSHHRSTADSLREYGRGIAGGLIFSLPLFYTMEVWWAAFTLHPGRILLYGVTTFALLLLYNRYVGLRRDATLVEVAIDSIEEMGIGLILSFILLWLLGRLDAGMSATELLGKVVMEAMTMAIGVSIGTAQLGGDDGDEGYSGDADDDPAAYLPQTSIAFCGAVLFAAVAAPADEIMVIGQESSPLKLLLIAGFSILIGALVLRFSGFHGADRHVASGSAGVLARGIVTTYAVCLVASVSSLWFFGKLDGDPFSLILAKSVVLGVPAVLGASAGRLLLQAGNSKNPPDRDPS